MEKFADFILRKRHALFGGLVIFTLISLFLATLVEVNVDMAEYLPEDSNLRTGLAVMEDEFGHLETTGLLHVMFEGLETDEMLMIDAHFSDLSVVLDVAFDIESDAHVRNDFTLYTLTVEAGLTSEEQRAFVQHIFDEFDEFDFQLSGDVEGIVPLLDMMFIIIPTVIILVLIFFVMCRSWFEPLIFFVNIGIAILINTGTNELFAHISAPSDMIAGVLQVALSMDYAVIFLNRYRREKAQLSEAGIHDLQLAMKNTILNSFSAISGIAFTTILGMLMLVFMSFTIGADIGLVIAKSVFISLICVFGVMPALILRFDKLIEKTSKPALNLKMGAVGNLSNTGKYVITTVFVILFAGAFLLQNNVIITYSEFEFDPIHRAFDLDNTFVLLYENTDESSIAQVIDDLVDQADILGIYAYTNLFGERFTDVEMATALEMDELLMALVFRNYFLETPPALSLGEFLPFLSEAAELPMLANVVQLDELAELTALPQVLEPEMMMQVFDATELAAFLELDESIVEQVLYLHEAFHGEPLEAEMTLFQLIDYLLTTFVPMPLFEALFTDETVTVLEDARFEIAATTDMLVSTYFSRMMINTAFAIESDETFAFIDDLYDILNHALTGEFYLLGESMMPYELQQTFPSEQRFITLLTTLAFFIVVTVSFKSTSIAILLAIVIQGSVFIAMGANYFLETNLSFLDIIVVQAILKSRVIDYGILYIDNYVEARETYDVKQAITTALNRSIETILTSGLIIVLVTFVCGLVFMGINVSIAQILFLIAQGCFIGILLSVFVLPALIAVFDRLIIKKKKRISGTIEAA
ncbi:MAG: MMPL family transporter [Defluviitaleaceae bacterium]|nr:MMPL family transporter [Defluviitaleaceae bacterium]